jgi:predicted  nucleic acid-binding Zn-ribbon protein
VKWLCTDCGDVFESDTTRHSMDRCDCGEAWADHEEHYVRRNSKAVSADERD